MLGAVFLVSIPACSSTTRKGPEKDEYEVRRNGLVGLVNDMYMAEWKQSPYALVYVAFYGDSPPRYALWGPFVSRGNCGDANTEEGACRYEIVISDTAISNGNVATLAEIAIPREGDVLISYYYIAWTSRDHWEILYSARARGPEERNNSSQVIKK